MPTEKTFHFLHQPGKPLILYNIWDAGSAEAVARAGAKALATGSASVAGALGYPDGEAVPLDTLLHVVARIRAVSDLPLTVDFEAGYGETSAEVADNAARLEDLGVAGVNLEDGIPPESGIRPAAEHAERIAAIRARTGLFINARTDLFLQNPPDTHATLRSEAQDRAAIYAKAGADGFFAPGLTDPALIGDLCGNCSLPVNIMASPAAPSIAELTDLKVARVSFGPFPWRDAMSSLTQAASEQLG